ncbi:hypothetical protein SAMN04487969_107106 [Paenibacillus algorifonticola]|uniref:ABC-2 family transporter protein n=1 Tax=Paenibacillus algorifonticola TaxID=684063 RepID=A0A1I2DMD9_9BACL|nr:hypothetical protein [Paenibacillus algorifonticola]SFE81812.1 hypothetical protein SAMN04487969_107106 [Paenibacillus algorifonticola]
MTSLRILFHMMKADYFERVRSYSFLITVLLSIFFVYKYIPSSDENYVTLSLQSIRGLYNSAWVGSGIAVLASMLLSLPAFFLVKNAIERDVQTGVGQIIATTPITRWMYTMGKMWSNFVFLMSIVAVLMVSALAMQLIRGEDYAVDFAALWLPFMYSTLPTMALVASIAIFFEAVPWLRKGLGNLIYFMIWIFSLIFSTKATHSNQDMFGISPIITKMSSEAIERIPNSHGGHVSGISPLKGDLLTYDWNGVHWTIQMFLERYTWLAVAVIIVTMASFFFHRFDLTRFAKINKTSKPNEAGNAEPHSKPVYRNDTEIKLTPYANTKWQSNDFKTLALELRLMLKGQRLWWYLVALVMIVLGLVLPMKSVVAYVVPFTWVWPVLIWSTMGTNETYYRTQPLIFTAMHPVRNPFIGLWLAGIIVAYLTGSGALIHFLIAGEWESLTAMVVGGLFIPTLAVALGIWSGNGKLFQVVFMLLWYMGPLNKWEALDFMGSTPQALDRGVYMYYLLATIILLMLAVIGRVRQAKMYS